MGPFPAILLMPFVLFWGTDFLQGYVGFFLTVLNFYLLYTIALRLGIKEKINALWLSFGYIFGTMYLGIALASDAWRFSQVIATSLLLLAISEYLGKKRFWLMGLLMALAVATRANLLLGLPFFVLGIFFDRKRWKERVRLLRQILLPVILAGLLLMSYNYVRFGTVFENGYSLSPYMNSRIGFTDSQRIALEYGKGKLLSPTYMPTNLYYYFLKGPEPILLTPESYILIAPFATTRILWGNKEFNNILIAAPFFLFAFLAKTKEEMVRQSWFAAGIIFLVLLFYYVPQRRYLLDVTPFLFIPLIRALGLTIPFPVKLSIVISFSVNLYFLFAP